MGGRFFKNQHGDILCDRIPDELLSSLTKIILAEFSHFFKKMEVVTCDFLVDKKDHGDIDFLCLIENNQKEEFRKYLKEGELLSGNNGSIDHIAYPFNKSLYQIDMHMIGTEEKYNICHYFYSKPVVFNSVIGQFARSLGYIFSTKGLLLLIRDSKKQNRKVTLTRDLSLIYDVLKLPPYNQNIFKSPETFTNWLIQSPRFDTERFKKSHNSQLPHPKG